MCLDFYGSNISGPKSAFSVKAIKEDDSDLWVLQWELTDVSNVLTPSVLEKTVWIIENMFCN